MMMEHNQIRNMLHLITIADLTPAQIEAAMGGIFLSSNSLEDQEETVEIVKTFQAVKVPTLGTLIPGSTAAVSTIGEAGVVKFFTPADNKSYILLGADCAALGGTVVVDFGLVAGAQFIKLASSGQVLNGDTSSFDYRNNILFDSGMVPAFRVTTGTVNHALLGLAYGEVVQ